jgi:hypothetical protein
MWGIQDRNHISLTRDAVAELNLRERRGQPDVSLSFFAEGGGAHRPLRQCPPSITDVLDNVPRNAGAILGEFPYHLAQSEDRPPDERRFASSPLAPGSRQIRRTSSAMAKSLSRCSR